MWPPWVGGVAWPEQPPAQVSLVHAFFEDYVAPRDRKPCDELPGEAKLTDAGRKVFGGDGITPDYCVEPEQPSKFVSYLIARGALVGFSRGYGATGSTGVAQIEGAGSRSEVAAGKVKIVSRDFQVDDQVLADLKAYLTARKLRFTDQDVADNRDQLSRMISEEVLRQAFGEGEARRRSLAWDPQVKKALDLIPKSEQLLREPQRFIADHAGEAAPVRTAPQPE